MNTAFNELWLLLVYAFTYQVLLVALQGRAFPLGFLTSNPKYPSGSRCGTGRFVLFLGCLCDILYCAPVPHTVAAEPSLRYFGLCGALPAECECERRSTQAPNFSVYSHEHLHKKASLPYSTTLWEREGMQQTAATILVSKCERQSKPMLPRFGWRMSLVLGSFWHLEHGTT